MFYNEEVKNKFLKDYLRSRVVSETSVKALLRKVGPIENKLNKDCCKFSLKEIVKMYKSFNAKSVNVLANYNVYLKGYTAFCIFHKLCEKNNYNNITKEELDKCIDPDILSQTIITREQLDDIQDMLYNYTDKAILECLWNGISGKSMNDITSLCRTSISDDKKSIYLKSGTIVPSDKKLLYYLENSFDENQYLCYGNRMIIQELRGEGCLYKEMKNAYANDSDDVRFRWIYRKIMTFRNFVDIPSLTMKNIQASGLLYKIKEGMNKTNLPLREYLRSDEGKKLAQQYGYKLNHYVNVIVDKYEWYFE